MSKELLANKSFIDHLPKRLNKSAKKHAFKKSLKLLNPVVTVSEDVDSFMKSLAVMAIEYDAYKMPRIAKRLIKFK